MAVKDSKLFQGSSYFQYFSVFLGFSLLFLASMQFFRSSYSLTLSGSLIRFSASVLLLAEVFLQGDRIGVFDRYFSISDVVSIPLGFAFLFYSGYSMFSVAFMSESLAISPVFQGFLDLGLAFLLFYQLLTE